MKLFIALLMMSTFAQATVFDCQNGDETDTLILEDHSVEIGGITMINMMDVDHTLPYRGYAWIHDPWYAFDVETKMMDGKAGYAHLRAHELQYGQTVVSKFYDCSPRE